MRTEPFTPEDVQAAVERTGLALLPLTYFDYRYVRMDDQEKRWCGCALTVLAIDQDMQQRPSFYQNVPQKDWFRLLKDDHLSGVISYAQKLDITIQQASAFMDGFDSGRAAEHNYEQGGEDYRQWAEAGIAVRNDAIQRGAFEERGS